MLSSAFRLNLSNMRATFGSVEWRVYIRIQTPRYHYVLAGKQNDNNL